MNWANDINVQMFQQISEGQFVAQRISQHAFYT